MAEAFAPELSPVPIAVPARQRDRVFDGHVRAPGWFDSSRELRS